MVKQRDLTIVTSQDWLESFGLGSRQYDGPAPMSLGQPEPTIPKPSHSKAKRILQREQDDKIDSRAYQSALVYRGESYKDSGKHWQRREPRDKLIAGRQRTDHAALKAIQDNVQAKSKRKSRLIKAHSIHHRLLEQEESKGG